MTTVTANISRPVSPPPEAIRSALQSSILLEERNKIAVKPAFNSRLHFIPIVLFLFFPTTFVLCYFIALMLGHINAFFSFISDAGTLPPEQNVFAQLTNVGSALFAYFVYIRFLQVEQYMKLRFRRTTTISNVIALAFGFTTSAGMSVVGNFPELVIKEVHLIGAFLAFVGGSIYSIFQGYFTFLMLPHFQTKCVAYMRTFLGILGLMLYFGAQSTIVVAFHKVKNKEKLESKPEALKWNAEDGGYNYRAASVIMEWLLVAIFDLFVISFASEFRNIKLAEPTIKFNMDEIEVNGELTQAEEIEAREVGSGLREVAVEASDGQLHMILDDFSLITEEDIIPIRGGSNSGRKLFRNKYLVPV